MIAESLGYFVGRAVIVAIALAIVSSIGLTVRAVARWARRGALTDIRNAIRDVTADDITALHAGQQQMRDDFAVMRDENATQHRQTVERLEALERGRK